MGNDISLAKPEAFPLCAGEVAAPVGRQDVADWYDLYATKVYRFARYRTGSEQDAQDLTQTVFERVWKNRHLFNAKKGNFQVWLFGIARNALRDHGRQKKREHPAPAEALDTLVDPKPAPDDQALAAETYRALRRALARLPEKQQTFVALKYGSGLHNTEIAEIMGVSPQNAGVILHRSLKRLRLLLEKEENENAQ